MLQVNPDSRPSVEDVHAELVAFAADVNVDLKSPIVVSVFVMVQSFVYMNYFLCGSCPHI